MGLAERTPDREAEQLPFILWGLRIGVPLNLTETALAAKAEAVLEAAITPRLHQVNDRLNQLLKGK
jgi:hypothetical protein